MYPNMRPAEPPTATKAPPDFRPPPATQVTVSGITTVGGVLAVAGFLVLPWLNLGVFGSLTGWDVLNFSSRFAGANDSIGAFDFFLWIVLLSAALELGVGIAGLTGRGSGGLNTFTIVAEVVSLAALVFGLYQIVNANATQQSAYVQVNYFNFIGWGVYVTVVGLIVGIIGGVTSRREHWG